MAKDYDDDEDADDRPRRPRNSRDDDDSPARRRRDEMDGDFADRPRSGRSDRGAGLGIASMIVGIISVPLCCFNWLSLPVSITAVILGFISRAQGGSRATSTTGIICGFVSIFLVIVVFALVMSGAIDAEKLKQMQQR